MPSFLTMPEKTEVEELLRVGPTLQSTPPGALKVTIDWIRSILQLLLTFINIAIGTLMEDIDMITDRVTALETTATAQPVCEQAAATATPVQPPRLSSRTRCKCCDALGHTTEECCTKDPAAIKKRVGHNQKERKRQAPAQLPPLPFDPATAAYMASAPPFYS